MKLRKKTIILIFSVCIIVFFSIFIITSIYEEINNKKFNIVLSRYDSLVLNTRLKPETNLIDSAFNLANSSIEYKIVLKRIKEANDYNKLYYYSKKALKKIPKDEQLLSIYIYSLLKTNNFDEAQKKLLSLKTANLPEYLMLETIIKSDSKLSTDSIFYEALSEKNSNLYSRLSRITKDKYFIVNAALLETIKGDFNKAEQLLATIEKKTIEINKLDLLVKYGNSKFNEVLEQLLVLDMGFSTQEMLLIKIDLNLKMKQYNSALSNITNFLGLYPDYSVSPYINFIYLNSFVTVNNINETIDTAIEYFPNNRNLYLSLIDYYSVNNNEKTAIELTKSYLANNMDKEFEIILKQLNGTKHPDRFINNIRELVNMDAKTPESSIFLAWSLFENNNIQDLSKYLEQQETETAWILFFKALISASYGENILSIESFKNSYKLESTWETLYNLGIINAYIKNYQKAIEYFQNSENILAFIPENSKLKSFIRTSLAMVFFEMNDYNNAYREIRNAYDLDSSNLKVHLLLKKLESNNY